MSIPYYQKLEINDIMRATFEKVLEKYGYHKGDSQQQQQELKVEVELKHNPQVEETTTIKLAKKLQKCQNELARAIEENMELKEELQKKEKELGELRSKVDQKQSEELQKQISLLKADISNLSELALSLLYCLQNGDCDISQARLVALNRLKLRALPETPPKLYTILKVRS